MTKYVIISVIFYYSLENWEVDGFHKEMKTMMRNVLNMMKYIGLEWWNAFLYRKVMPRISDMDMIFLAVIKP